jgi:hypothetical protein
VLCVFFESECFRSAANVAFHVIAYESGRRLKVKATQRER